MEIYYEFKYINGNGSIADITPYKDTSFAMGLNFAEGHSLFYAEQKDLSIVQGQPFAQAAVLELTDELRNTIHSEIQNGTHRV